MKLIDEVSIHVKAGDGGNDFMSFHRERFIERDDPNGGDGGDGGSIYLGADVDLNTLVDYRYTHRFDVQHGENGGGKGCTGAKGDDLVLPASVGTTVIDANTQEIIGDLTEPGQRLMVTQGDWYGPGDTCFKSSTNRALCQTTPDKPSEACDPKLKLRVLAGVGLLGLSSVGKSALIRAMSAVKPKVADHPSTILVPNLGVVNVGRYKSSVIADILGLTEGAVEGTGLDIHSPRHPTRTRILLRLVDMAPLDESDPTDAAEVIVRELGRFDSALTEYEHRLVLNRMDQILDPTEREVRKQVAIERLDWEGPVYMIFALGHNGIEALGQDIMRYFGEHTPCLEEGPQYTEELAEFDRRIEDEAWARLQALDDARVLRRSGLKNAGAVDDDDFDGKRDDGDGLEIFYIP